MERQANRTVPKQKDRIARGLLRWYERNRRDLPWRPPIGSRSSADPYAVLVSEFMLQQTQVVTVTPYFLRFIKAYPTIGQLAAVPEQEVLRLWQGLGYYSRARNLRAAARMIATEFGGRIPCSPQELMSLPGVGRYTAGAVASIAFDHRAPILDGNVARVLCRLGMIQSDPEDPKTREMLWRRAEEILPRTSVGDFNSALMELGATLCTPTAPRCPVCPLRRFCRAAEAGLQESIPRPRRSRPTPLLLRWTFCLSRANRWLIERRPDKGRWAGLWQFPTIKAADGQPVAAIIGRQMGVRIRELREVGQLRHALTHRKYLFKAFAATAMGNGRITSEPMRRWVKLNELEQYPLSRPQAKIAEMISSL
ncbi:MAG: A/G-specific adenine glycosylase [Tepidisphaeraceae bacterium]